MKLLTRQDAWELFLEEPSASRFIALRDLIVGEDNYHPCPSVISEISELSRDQQHERLQRRVDALLPAWAICPRIHFLAGGAAEALGDWEEAELCRFLTATCNQGLRSTGNGTRRRPWLTTYPSDLQDCLAGLGEGIANVQLVEGDDGLLDIVTATTGRTYWFDVTEMVAAAGEVSTSAGIATQ